MVFWPDGEPQSYPIETGLSPSRGTPNSSGREGLARKRLSDLLGADNTAQVVSSSLRFGAISAI
jgi:hypothetical protein